jgi:protein-L-isoaspartate(D-aspartate) O-methyltransferase
MFSSHPISTEATIAAMVIVAACLCDAGVPAQPPQARPPTASKAVAEEARFAELRREMVESQLRTRDIVHPDVLRAMARVPRHRFVRAETVDAAYRDGPLPIGHGQTISQPYIVALMTQLIEPTPQSRVLDVGTGSGYQAAVLADLCKHVYGIEILKPLADEAAARLAALGYKNVTLRQGDGYRGWKEHAPFDAIVVAAAASHVPQPLLDQLAPGGRLVMPVGRYSQELLVIRKRSDGTFERRSVIPVLFVPMTGEAQRRDR